MLSSYKPKNYNFLFIVLGALVALPFLLLNLYNNPSMDDYTFAIRDNELGFIEAQLKFYFEWSGRYFGTASARLNPIIHHNFAAYKLYSFIVFVVFFIAITTLLHSLLKSYLGRQSILALTAFLFVIILVQMPDIAQGIYWFSGYITYLFPTIFTLLLLSVLLRLKDATGTVRSILKITGLLLAFAVIGANELSLVGLMATLLFILLTTWVHSKQLPPYLLILFFIGLILSLIVVLAPGNYIRMADQERASQLWYSIAGSIAFTLVDFLKWGFLLLLSSLIYFIMWGLPLAKSTVAKSIFKCSLPLALLWYLSTLFMMEFIFLWSTGFRASTRVENVIYFFFVFGWFYILQVIINNHIFPRYQPNTSFSNLLLLPLTALFCAVTFDLNSNVTTAYLDLLSGRAKKFDTELAKRYDYLLQSNCTSCPIKPVAALPKSLFIFSDLRPDELEEMGINDEFAAYWKKEDTYLTAPTPPIQDNLSTLKQIAKDWRACLFSIK